MRSEYYKILIIAELITVVFGCAGTRTFHEVARAGDTVAVPAGQRDNFRRDNITVTVTDSAGGMTIYPPGNPAVRSSVNLYLDPLSSMIVTDRTGVDQTITRNSMSIRIIFTIPAVIMTGGKVWFLSTCR